MSTSTFEVELEVYPDGPDDEDEGTVPGQEAAGGRHRIRLRVSDPDLQFDNSSEWAVVQFPAELYQRGAVDPLAYGQKLTTTILAPDGLREVFNDVVRRSAIDGRACHFRAYLSRRDPWLQVIRWETLLDGRREGTPTPLFTNARTFFSRFPSTPRQVVPVHFGKLASLRALVVVAAPRFDPDGPLPPIDRDEELTIANQALGAFRPENVSLLNGPSTLNGIAEKLGRDPVDVLYLIGHGVLAGDEPEIVLEASDGGPTQVRGIELVKMLAGLECKPSLVFLTVCQSASEPARARGFRGIGQLLATDVGIGSVIAMQGRVGVGSARKFVKIFFKQLCTHGNVPCAVAEARHSVSLDQQADWWIPVLFFRMKTSNVVTIDAPDHPLWNEAERRCNEQVRNIWERTPAAQDDLYVPRSVEADFERFVLVSDKSTMVIIGQSGMGKTTLAARMMKRFSEEGHLCMFISSARLLRPAEEVERLIVEQFTEATILPKDFWTEMNKECSRRGKKLIVIFDAVNEFNPLAGAPEARQAVLGTSPLAFLERLNAMAEAARAYPNVKYLITSRPETWRRGLDRDLVRIRDSKGAYFVAREGLAHELPRFDEVEAQRAYEKYRRSAYRIATPYKELDALTRYLLRDPLLLMVTCRTFRGRAIPAGLDTNDLFDAYRKLLIDEGTVANQPVAEALETLVAAMFDAREGSTHLIVRDSVPSSGVLSASEIAYLLERNVLRLEGQQVRLMYDRFAEHLFAARLLRELERRQTIEAKVGIICGNLPIAQRLNTAFAALQRTLVLSRSQSVNHGELLKAVAAYDERGLALVVAALARLAMVASSANPSQGIDLLQELLSAAQRDVERRLARKHRAGDKPLFPVIDAVYRILLDQEYRNWLEEKGSLKAVHLRVLHSFFIWGFKHAHAVISGGAIQYLYFLWQRDKSIEDAIAITQLLVEQTRPLSLGSALSAQKNLVANTMGLFILILAEARDDKSMQRILPIAKSFIRRLDLRFQRPGLRGALWLFPILLGYYAMKNIFAHVPNPINLKALRRLLRSKKHLADFAQVFSLCEPGPVAAAAWRNISPERLAVLARSNNSFVFQMLSFALSARHERATTAAERAEALRSIEAIYESTPTHDTAEYCASIAMYHINYFGNRELVTEETLKIMGHMAGDILLRHKGQLSIDSDVPGQAPEQKNFNIIGTYGRALWQNGEKLGQTREARLSSRALKYAVDALEDAKRRRDFDYYQYVCDNIGLLGVLIEPQQVLEVVAHVLRDVALLESQRETCFEPLPFPDDQREKLRNIAINSLANIRVLYKQEVDAFLLEDLEKPDLHARVAVAPAEFKLSDFYSWTFEQLMFRLLTSYYEPVGRLAMTTIREAVKKPSARSCLTAAVRKMISDLAMLSP